MKGELIHDLFDGSYIINKQGEIFSRYDYDFKHGYSKICERIDKDGYPVVNLTVKGNRKTVNTHRLLGETFLPNRENKSQINHKNGNKLDYSLENLEWATPVENMQHAMDTGLCKPPKQPRKIIDTSTGKEYPSIKKAAADLNITYSNCKKYLTGRVKNKTTLRYA